MKRYTIQTGVFAVLVVAVLLLAGCGSPTPPRLQLEITSPSARVETSDPELSVTGIVSDAGATVKVNGVAVRVDGDGAFTHTLPLPYGNTRVTVAAEMPERATSTRTINVSRKLVLNVATPAKESVVEENEVTVAGTVSDLAARIFITGAEVLLGEDGSFSTNVPLHYAETIIRVAAVVDNVEPLYTLLTVKRAQ